MSRVVVVLLACVAAAAGLQLEDIADVKYGSAAQP